MKCHAGIEFPNGAPCPKCGAKLGEVCWPGINADLLELPRLRANFKDVVETKRRTDERLKIALAALQTIYDESCEDNITLIAGKAFEEATRERPRSAETSG